MTLDAILRAESFDDEVLALWRQEIRNLRAEIGDDYEQDDTDDKRQKRRHIDRLAADVAKIQRKRDSR
jgi:hypothetical protein